MIHKTGIRIEQTVLVKQKQKQRLKKKIENRNKQQKQYQSQNKTSIRNEHTIAVKDKTIPHTTNNVIKT